MKIFEDPIENMGSGEIRACMPVVPTLPLLSLIKHAFMVSVFLLSLLQVYQRARLV